ncbi:MAG: hypothetical protein IPK26_10500 [Planctomycetes bacterium]|nr:hypothetical protein [Planctomycetota bacterium]
MNDSILAAHEHRLDALLAELGGAQPAEDLSARIRMAAATARGARRGSWLMAAGVLLGVAVVTGLAFWKRDSAQQAIAPTDTQDPDKKPEPRNQAFERLIRDLELPERRQAAIVGLNTAGNAATSALAAALAAEQTRGRPEALAGLHQAWVGFDFAAAKAAGGLPAGRLELIADYSDNRILGVNADGEKVFELKEVFGAWDAELTPRGTILITEFSVSRVQEVDLKGNAVWAFEDLKNPYDADRLGNGNTLIADTFGSRVIEVNPVGEIVWQYDKDIRPFDVDRLRDGNTLIADVLQDRVLEVTKDGKIAWELKGLNNVHDADRLPNGNTLVTLRGKGVVLEFDAAGEQVWKLEGLSSPSDADRLPNGNTIVAENTRVREFDASGQEVYRKEMTWAVEVGRY